MTEYAQAMPERYVRMTIWRVRNANLELVQASELVRGAKTSPEPAAAQMAGRLSTVRLSASAIAEAQVLAEEPVRGLSSYMVRRTQGDPRKLSTTVSERRGRLQSMLTQIEARDGINWWTEGTVARVFDSTGVQSVIVSQYPKPKSRRVGG